MLNIEIDGRAVQVPNGSTLMDAANKLDIYVPHFCWHRKLTIAANCRMCLVQVEKAPKPLPACATPATEGMKVWTHSDAAVDYMLRSKGDGGYGVGGRIAAPGFSNHQGGIALDLWQDRTKGDEIGNDSDDPARCRWRQSWFHGWLRTHAAAYGFQPIATEEWHWEYRPGV